MSYGDELYSGEFRFAAMCKDEIFKTSAMKFIVDGEYVTFIDDDLRAISTLHKPKWVIDMTKWKVRDLEQMGVIADNSYERALARINAMTPSEYAKENGYNLVSDGCPAPGTYWLMLATRSTVEGVYAGDGKFHIESWFGLSKTPLDNVVGWKKKTYYPPR